MQRLDVMPLVVGGLTGSGCSMVGSVIADWTARRRIDGSEVNIELIEGVLNSGNPVIVTVSGGTLIALDERGALAKPVVVWLNARPRTLVTRANGGIAGRRSVRMSDVLGEIPFEHEIYRRGLPNAVIEVDALDLFTTTRAVLDVLRSVAEQPGGETAVTLTATFAHGLAKATAPDPVVRLAREACRSAAGHRSWTSCKPLQ